MGSGSRGSLPALFTTLDWAYLAEAPFGSLDQGVLFEVSDRFRNVIPYFKLLGEGLQALIV